MGERLFYLENRQQGPLFRDYFGFQQEALKIQADALLTFSARVGLECANLLNDKRY